MKYRIKKQIMWNNTTRFIPQYQYLFLPFVWFNYKIYLQGGATITQTFKKYDETLDFISSKIKSYKSQKVKKTKYITNF